MKAHLLLLCVILLVNKQLIDAVVWEANNYPNPTTQVGAKSCGLRSAGNLCDPDGILTEAERYRVNHELSRLETNTYQEFGDSFCEKKGLTGVIGLAKNVKGGKESDVKRMATELRQRWNLDAQCLKGFVLIISIEDKQLWVSRDGKIPVYAGDFNEILNAQKPLFRDKKHSQALLNIIKQTAEKTLSKQGSLPAPAPRPPSPADDGRGTKGKGGSGGGMSLPSKLPNIPMWLILVIVLVVVPLLICCCCCVYCCFCRNKQGSNRRQGPSDDPEAQGQSGGGIGNTLRGMLSGAGGGMVMNMIQNCFRNRGGGSGGQQPQPNAGDRGDYIPPRPQASEGKGLYPSKTVEDEGAGGGW